MKKYEKPYLEVEIINFVDICNTSQDGDVGFPDEET